MDKTQLKQADQLVKQFRSTKERGEFRNKIGRIVWPMVNRAITYGVPLGVAATVLTGGATLPVLAFSGAIWAGGRFLTKGAAVYVQNIALKNAAVFGRSMTQNKVPDDLKTLAMDRYLKKAGAMVFNKQYLKQNPEAISQLANGKPVEGIPNIIATFEHNINQAINNAERHGHMLETNKRLQVYKKTWRDYQGLKRPKSLRHVLRDAQTVQTQPQPTVAQATPQKQSIPMDVLIRNRKQNS